MQIVEYSEAHKDDIISLLCGLKSVEYEKYKRLIWKWQFEDNPSIETTSPFIVFEEGGRVVGFNASMPVGIRYNGQEIEALWSCDTILAASLRGRGQGKALLHAIQVKKPIVMGLGISDKASPVLIRNGWQVNQDIETYYYSSSVRSIKDIAKKLVQTASALSMRARKGGDSDVRVSVVDAAQIPPELDVLWDRVVGDYEKIVIRNHRYLAWKYGSHPLAKYQAILIERGGDLAALGVFRHEAERSRLVDYVGPRDAIDLKRTILKVFKEYCADSHRLECMCTDPEFKQVVLEMGFLRYRKNRPRFYVISNIDNDIGPADGWFAMAGDSDEDLLYAAGLTS